MLVTIIILLLILGGVFALSGGARALGRRHLKPIIVVLALLVIAALGYGYISDFLLVDACLDGGGRWNYDARFCEK